MNNFKSKINRGLKYLANDLRKREFVEYIKYDINIITI